MGRWAIGPLYEGTRDQTQQGDRPAGIAGTVPPLKVVTIILTANPLNYFSFFPTHTSGILGSAFLPLLVPLRVVLGGFTCVTACPRPKVVFIAVGFPMVGMYCNLPIHYALEGHVGSFRLRLLGTVLHRMFLCLWSKYIGISIEYIPKVYRCPAFVDSANGFPKQPYPFTLPPAMYKGSSCPIMSSKLKFV